MMDADRLAEPPLRLVHTSGSDTATHEAVPPGGRSALVPCLIVYALLAAVWTWLTWGPVPQVVLSGDGSNVASIAAGWLERSRFAHDPVLATPEASRFYMALSVPLTMLLGRLLGDIGSGYMLQTAPLLFAQLVGFHLLGLRLYRRTIFAVALALATVPPVFVFSGELWGMLQAPLTRSFAGAALPWILLLLLGSARGTHSSPFAVMAACGATIYLHPVSAPAIAAGCWLAMLADRPPETRWFAHLGRLIIAALVFFVIALPFVVVFAKGFPGAVPVSDPERAKVAEILRSTQGILYYDVGVVIAQMRLTEWGWRWFVWGAGVAALLLVPLLDARARRPLRLIAVFLAGVLVSSLGLAAIDQWIAAALDRAPVQLDLVRNVRFVVPMLLLLAIWLAAILVTGRSPGPFRKTAAVMLVLGFTGCWWYWHPNPIQVAVSRALGQPTAGQSDRSPDSRMLARIRELPPDSRILPLTDESIGYVEVVGLAVRYAAFQPVVFLEKDVNLLGYSGSKGAIDWSHARPDVAAFRTATQPESDEVLRRIIDRLRPDYLMVHDQFAPPALVGAHAGVGPVVAAEGPWRLFAMSAEARNRAQSR